MMNEEFKAIGKEFIKRDMEKKSYEVRSFYSEEIAKAFCNSLELCKCRVKIINSPRPNVSGTNQYLFGEYRNKTVVIYNLTPKKQKPITTSVFIDTLLHELLHHFDQFEFGLYAEHDNKFYKRLNQIKDFVLCA